MSGVEESALRGHRRSTVIILPPEEEAKLAQIENGDDDDDIPFDQFKAKPSAIKRMEQRDKMVREHQALQQQQYQQQLQMQYAAQQAALQQQREREMAAAKEREEQVKRAAAAEAERLAKEQQAKASEAAAATAAPPTAQTAYEYQEPTAQRTDNKDGKKNSLSQSIKISIPVKGRTGSSGNMRPGSGGGQPPAQQPAPPPSNPTFSPAISPRSSYTSNSNSNSNSAVLPAMPRTSSQLQAMPPQRLAGTPGFMPPPGIRNPSPASVTNRAQSYPRAMTPGQPAGSQMRRRVQPPPAGTPGSLRTSTQTHGKGAVAAPEVIGLEIQDNVAARAQRNAALHRTPSGLAYFTPNPYLSIQQQQQQQAAFFYQQQQQQQQNLWRMSSGIKPPPQQPQHVPAEAINSAHQQQTTGHTLRMGPDGVSVSAPTNRDVTRSDEELRARGGRPRRDGDGGHTNTTTTTTTGRQDDANARNKRGDDSGDSSGDESEGSRSSSESSGSPKVKESDFSFGDIAEAAVEANGKGGFTSASGKRSNTSSQLTRTVTQTNYDSDGSDDVADVGEAGNGQEASAAYPSFFEEFEELAKQVPTPVPAGVSGRSARSNDATRAKARRPLSPNAQISSFFTDDFMKLAEDSMVDEQEEEEATGSAPRAREISSTKAASPLSRDDSIDLWSFYDSFDTGGGAPKVPKQQLPQRGQLESATAIEESAFSPLLPSAPPAAARSSARATTDSYARKGSSANAPARTNGRRQAVGIADTNANAANGHGARRKPPAHLSSEDPQHTPPAINGESAATNSTGGTPPVPDRKEELNETPSNLTQGISGASLPSRHDTWGPTEYETTNEPSVAAHPYTRRTSSAGTQKKSTPGGRLRPITPLPTAESVSEFDSYSGVFGTRRDSIALDSRQDSDIVENASTVDFDIP